MSNPRNQEVKKFLEEKAERAASLNKSFEKDIRKAITEPGADENDFVMELEEDDWGSEPSPEKQAKLTVVLEPPKTKTPEPVANKEVQEEQKIESPVETKINGQHLVDIPDEDDDIILKRKATTPLIRTVMTTVPPVDSEKFGIANWAEFQDMLKSNYFVITTEFETKEKLVKGLKQSVMDYAKGQLNIREKNEIIHKKRHHEQHHEDEMAKVLSDEYSQRLKSAAESVKQLLYMIYDNPMIVALIAKNNENLAALRTVEDTLALSFYENILIEEGSDHDVLRLFAALLQLELGNAKKYADILHPDLFFNRMWSAYLKRNECKAYIKNMLRDPLIGCIKERTKIKTDIKDVKRDIEKRRQKAQKNSVTKAESISQSQKIGKPGSDAEAFLNKESAEGPLLNFKSKQSGEPIVVPKFKDRKQTTPFDELRAVPKKSFEIVFESAPVSPLRLMEDREVGLCLERNFNVLKKYLGIIIQSVFDNLENMPMGLRILCKIIHTLIKKKFPTLTEKESYEVLANYLFRRWICPSCISPGYSGILDDFESSSDLAHNLIEITKALQQVFNLTIYPNGDIRSELNDYFREIMPSVQKYFKELISVNEDSVQEIIYGKPLSTRVKSKSICLSLYEIKILCECIVRHKAGVEESYPKAAQLAEKILAVDQAENIFTFGIDSNTGQAIKSSQNFILFYDIVLPGHVVSDYVDEFTKIVGFSKLLPDDEKVLCKVKHALKNFLLSSKDIKNLIRWAPSGNFTLDSILEQNSDKGYCEELNAHKRNERAPIHITARFVTALLSQLSPSYKLNNYYRLHHEMMEEFKGLTERLDLSVSTIKLQLLKASDIVKAKSAYLNEVKKDRNNALRRENVWEFIKSLRLPICVTSPSTMGSFFKEAAKNNPKKSKLFSDKIEVLLRSDKGCIHDQFSIMKELTISAGSIALGSTKTKSASKSMSQASSFTGGGSNNNNSAFDDMSYHVETVDEFINLFGSLEEVRQTIIDGKDSFGVNNAVVFLYNLINDEVRNKFKNVEDEELNFMTDEIENYICKRLYYKTFPATDIEADKAFWRKCKTLEWVNFDDLEIIPRNRYAQLWEYAALTFNQIDNRITPAEKLICMLDCFKIITQVLDLASSKEGSGGSDETLPIMIYVILKSCPKKIHSNLNFIEFFRDPRRMLAGEGFCFIQTKSAVIALQNADHEFFRISKEKYAELINAKEVEHGFAIKK